MARKTTFLAGLIFLLSSLLFAQGELYGPVYIIGDDGRLYIDNIPDTVTASYLAVIDDGWLKKLDIDNLELDTSNIAGLYDYLNAKSDTGHVHDTSDVNSLSLYLGQKLDVTDTSDLARKIHNHTISDVTGLQDALALKLDVTELDNYYTKTQLQTSGQASVHWGNLTNKPSVFPPASHNHDASNINSGTLSDSRLSFNPDYFVQGGNDSRSTDSGSTDINTYTQSGFYRASSDALNLPLSQTFNIIHSQNPNTSDYANQLAFSMSEDRLFIRRNSGGAWYTKEIWNSGNLDPSDYALVSQLDNYYTKTNLSTSGESSVHWGNITNEPSFITGLDWDEIGGTQSLVNVSGFNNDAGYLTDIGGKPWVYKGNEYSGSLRGGYNTTRNHDSGIQDAPVSYMTIGNFNFYGTNYDFQMGATYSGANRFFLRSFYGSAGVWNPWVEIWNSGNLDPSDYALVSHNHSASDITSGTLSDSRLSSNVFSKKTDIPGGADLNNYTNIGFYHQNSDSYAASGTNYPVDRAGMLEVQSDGAMVYQRYTQYNTGEIHTRSYYAGAWYAWNKVWDNGNLDPSDYALVSHNHSASDITSGTLSNDRLSFNPDYFVQGSDSYRRDNYNSTNTLDDNNASGFFRLDLTDPANPDGTNNYYGFRTRNSVNYSVELVGKAGSKLLFGGLDGGTRQPWREIWHSGNLDTANIVRRNAENVFENTLHVQVWDAGDTTNGIVLYNNSTASGTAMEIGFSYASGSVIPKNYRSAKIVAGLKYNTLADTVYNPQNTSISLYARPDPSFQMASDATEPIFEAGFKKQQAFVKYHNNPQIIHSEFEYIGFENQTLNPTKGVYICVGRVNNQEITLDTAGVENGQTVKILKASDLLAIVRYGAPGNYYWRSIGHFGAAEFIHYNGVWFCHGAEYELP